MKQILVASVLFATLINTPACLATNDSDQAASEVSGIAVLASIAVPYCITYIGVGVTAGTTHQLLKLVDKSGDALSDLTADGIDQLDKIDAALNDRPDQSNKKVLDKAPHVILAKKEIPLIVRPGYVELNQKVNLRELPNAAQ